MAVYVFPGQGSQRKGMGADLFSHFPERVAEADSILGYSIQTLCVEDPLNQLNETQYTQPALYVVNALSYFKNQQEMGKKPDYVAGHSLGEFNALLAANVFDFATGLRLVQKRGELMSQAQGGSMAAIIGLEKEQVMAVLEAKAISDVVMANHNSYTQVVISGPKNSIPVAQSALKEEGAKVIPLTVSGAFHSPLMKQASTAFTELLSRVVLNNPSLPVIANVSAKPYVAGQVLNTLAKQITSAVRWCETITFLLEKGEDIFEEIGPGTVLTNLITHIRKRKAA